MAEIFYIFQQKAISCSGNWADGWPLQNMAGLIFFIDTVNVQYTEFIEWSLI
jgi:hypothetical protein